MHQSPLKQLGGPRREKYAASEFADGDSEAERRLQRGSQPKARKFQLRDEVPRGERGGRQYPRG